MRRRTRGLVLVVLGVAASACTAIAGLTEDYRLAGDGTTTEGGAGDGNLDKDGALPDGGQDGGPDALPATDGGKRFCDGVTKDVTLDFCEDFEDAPLAVGKPPDWSSLKNTADASVAVVTGGKSGSTRMLEVDSLTASTSRNIYLVRMLARTQPPEKYLKYEVEFDFILFESGPDYESLGVINFTGLSTEDYGVAAYPTDSILGKVSPAAAGVPIGLTAWHHAHILLTHTLGTPFTIRTTIDGEGTSNIVDATSGISVTAASATEIRIGIFSSGPQSGRAHAAFDNVVSHRTL